MHKIEPFYLWRDHYISELDPNANNYGKEYSELYFTDKIYNYVIHPQWDSFGSETLFYKQIFADYDSGTCVIEFIGEWNDAINNDIMYLKTELIDPLIDAGISNFILIMENVLNFHSLDLDYYEEWADDIEGEIYMINALPQVLDELDQRNFNQFINYGDHLNEVNWRILEPDLVYSHIANKFKESEYNS